jgi:hypothetical protein
MNISLSSPSKMPCHSWSISALQCKTGAKLAKIKGSICHGCYALKGNYRFGNVQRAQAERLEQSKRKGWWKAMVETIKGKEKSGFFRWFDAGDLQSFAMLRDIVKIAEALPDIRFWLPTKEYAFVSRYLEKYGSFPENLTVRLSAYMIDKDGPNLLAEQLGLTTSEVRTKGETCPAPRQGNKCLECRACWDKSVGTVVYKKH